MILDIIMNGIKVVIITISSIFITKLAKLKIHSKQRANLIMFLFSAIALLINTTLMECFPNQFFQYSYFIVSTFTFFSLLRWCISLRIAMEKSFGVKELMLRHLPIPFIINFLLIFLSFVIHSITNNHIELQEFGFSLFRMVFRANNISLLILGFIFLPSIKNMFYLKIFVFFLLVAQVSRYFGFVFDIDFTFMELFFDLISSVFGYVGMSKVIEDKKKSCEEQPFNPECED